MSEWQPIETAPKDGTWIALWRGSLGDNIGWSAPLIFGRWWSFNDGQEIWVWPDDVFDPFTEHGRAHAEQMIESGDCYESNQFTHWMPLPEPPK